MGAVVSRVVDGRQQHIGLHVGRIRLLLLLLRIRKVVLVELFVHGARILLNLVHLLLDLVHLMLAAKLGLDIGALLVLEQATVARDRRRRVVASVRKVADLRG